MRSGPLGVASGPTLILGNLKTVCGVTRELRAQASPGTRVGTSVVSAAPRPGLQTRPRRLSGSPWGHSHPREGRSQARAPGQALCLLSGSKGPGPQLLGSVLRGAPQPSPPRVPVPRGHASPKKGLPTLTQLPSNSHGPEVVKSRQSRLAPGSHTAAHVRKPSLCPAAFWENLGKLSLVPTSFSKQLPQREILPEQPGGQQTPSVHETLTRQVEVEDLSRKAAEVNPTEEPGRLQLTV